MVDNMCCTLKHICWVQWLLVSAADLLPIQQTIPCNKKVMLGGAPDRLLVKSAKLWVRFVNDALGWFGV